MWKEATVVYLKEISWNFLKGSRKIKKNSGQSVSGSRLNPELSEYEVEC
jgi:hypothetical protein